MAASSVGSSRLPLSASLAFSDLTEEMLDCGPGGFVRELEELRSENDYLKVRSLPRRRCPGGSPRSGCGLGPASPGVPAPKALPPSASHFPAPDTPGAGNLSQSCGRSSETCGSSRFSTHLACF